MRQTKATLTKEITRLKGLIDEYQHIYNSVRGDYAKNPFKRRSDAQIAKANREAYWRGERQQLARAVIALTDALLCQPVRN